MTRAFVAVGLDEATRGGIGALVEQLRPLCRAVAWVPPENLHLTLKFLGEQGEARLADAAHALEEAALAQPAFAAHLHGLGAFPGMEQARILWVGLAEGALEARALQARVEVAFEARGFPRESRPWHPHLTIGRVFDPRRWRREASPALREAIARASGRGFGRLHVARVMLMRSDLSRAGARYRPLSTADLGGGGAAPMPRGRPSWS